jgi:ubiquinone/menaquinone biosynthesis C-methylase UbiE
MDDARLLDEGFAGRLPAGSPEFERFVDLTARRPSGAIGTAHYREALQHSESFALALDALELSAEDRFLDICFGGGQLLERALKAVRTAAGIDHSADMHGLARERNAEALEAGRLELVEGDVHKLPWPDGEFTHAACLNAFFFIDAPHEFLAEVSRVLASQGRFVLVTASEDASGSGPWAPALRTYPAAVLHTMLVRAGFSVAEIDQSGGQQIAIATRS